MMSGFRGEGKRGFSDVGREGTGEVRAKGGWSALPALQIALLNVCRGVNCMQAETCCGFGSEF